MNRVAIAPLLPAVVVEPDDRDALTIDPEYTDAKESLEDVLKAIEFRRLRSTTD
jgi:hypothetical protein